MVGWYWAIWCDMPSFSPLELKNFGAFCSKNSRHFYHFYTGQGFTRMILGDVVRWIQDRPGTIQDSYSRYAIFDAEHFGERGDGILQRGNGKVMGWVLFSMLILYILCSSCFHFLHTQMFVAPRNHSLAVCAQQRKEVQPQFSASQLCRSPTSTPLWGPRYFRGNWWNGGRQLWNTGGIWWNLYIDEFSKMVASVLHIVSTLWAKESAAFLELAPLGKSRGSLTTWNGHQPHRVGTSLGKDSPWGSSNWPCLQMVRNLASLAWPSWLLGGNDCWGVRICPNSKMHPLNGLFCLVVCWDIIWYIIWYNYPHYLDSKIAGVWVRCVIATSFDATVDMWIDDLQLLRSDFHQQRSTAGHGDVGVDGKQLDSSKEKWDDGVFMDEERCWIDWYFESCNEMQISWAAQAPLFIPFSDSQIERFR